jgi:hypothetical protein
MEKISKKIPLNRKRKGKQGGMRRGKNSKGPPWKR